MDDKKNDQLLSELTVVQKILDERTQTQGHIVKKFNSLISNEGLFSQIVDLLPYPMVVYTQSYQLILASRAFLEAINSEAESFNNIAFLNWYKATDIQLVEASRKVFTGKSTHLQNLKDPFSLFVGTKVKKDMQTKLFQSAVVFPILDDKNEVTHGVIVFLPHS